MNREIKFRAWDIEANQMNYEKNKDDVVGDTFDPTFVLHYKQYQPFTNPMNNTPEYCKCRQCLERAEGIFTRKRPQFISDEEPGDPIRTVQRDSSYAAETENHRYDDQNH